MDLLPEELGAEDNGRVSDGLVNGLGRLDGADFIVLEGITAMELFEDNGLHATDGVDSKVKGNFGWGYLGTK